MNTLQYIAIIINFNDRFRSFACYAKALTRKNYKVTFIRNRFSIDYEAREMGQPVIPVITSNTLFPDTLLKNLGQISGLSTEKQARTIYTSTVLALEKSHKSEKY